MNNIYIKDEASYKNPHIRGNSEGNAKRLLSNRDRIKDPTYMVNGPDCVSKGSAEKRMEIQPATSRPIASMDKVSNNTGKWNYNYGNILEEINKMKNEIDHYSGENVHLFNMLSD